MARLRSVGALPELRDQGQHEPDGAQPEEEHPLDQLGAHGCQLGVQPGVTLCEPAFNPSLELRVEPREVQLVQVTELGPVGQVHLY